MLPELDTVKELEEIVKSMEGHLDKGIRLEIFSFISDYSKSVAKLDELEKEYSDLKKDIKGDLKSLSSSHGMKSKIEHTENLLRLLSDSLNVSKQRTANANNRLKTITPLLEKIKKDMSETEGEEAKFNPTSDVKKLEKYLQKLDANK